MRGKETLTLNNKKVVKYSRMLIKNIEINDGIIDDKIHNDVINFCTVVLKDNPNIYKKINIDSINIPEPVNITIVKDTKSGPKEQKLKMKINSELEELINQEIKVLDRIIKIYSLKEKLI